MTIYIEADYVCHTEPAADRRAVVTEAFNGIAPKAIECYVLVPAGEAYHGIICTEGFIQCFDSAMADNCQREWESEQIKEQMADMKNALSLLGVKEDEQVDD